MRLNLWKSTRFTINHTQNLYEYIYLEFHDKVQQSKLNAEKALHTIGDIENHIREAGNLVDEADKVSFAVK